MTTLDKLSTVTPKVIKETRNVPATPPGEAVQARQEIAASGKNTPVNEPTKAVQEPKKQELDMAISSVSGYVQNITRELHFSVDEDLGRFVVQVTDQQTGDVIRQIPTEDMLELSKTLSEVKERAAKGILFKGDA